MTPQQWSIVALGLVALGALFYGFWIIRRDNR